jgi:hypothetical protein
LVIQVSLAQRPDVTNSYRYLSKSPRLTNRN